MTTTQEALISKAFRYYFVYRVPVNGKTPTVLLQGFAAQDEQGRPTPTTLAGAQAMLAKAIKRAQAQGLKPAETASIAAAYANGHWSFSNLTLFPKVAVK